MPRRTVVLKPASKRPKIASKGYKIPETLPRGTILTDYIKKKWRILKSIAHGGFGEIYLVTKEDTSSNDIFALKLECYSNGPLFTEVHFYMRVAKPDLIGAWVKKKKLDFLGVPEYVIAGIHEYNGEETRFLVMKRFGIDIQKIFARKKCFSKKTVLVLAIRLLDILEYIHSHEYVHGDIKGSNILLGYGNKINEIYLVDYGLAIRYAIDNRHKEYKEDLKKAHNGTIEYTSLDAHHGVSPSRRSDLQILGYNLLHWLSGTLPWLNNLEDKNWVRTQKLKYKNNISGLMESCFSKGDKHRELQSYLEIVMDLEYTDIPPYNQLRSLFKDSLGQSGSSLILWNKSEAEEICGDVVNSEDESEDESDSLSSKNFSRPNYGKSSQNINGSSAPRKRRSNQTDSPDTNLVNISSLLSIQPRENLRSSRIKSPSNQSRSLLPVKKKADIRRRRCIKTVSVSTQTTPGLKRKCAEVSKRK